jgi:transposase
MQLIAKTVKGHKYWYLVQKGRKNGVVTNIKTIYLGSADRLAERLSTEGAAHFPEAFESWEMGASAALWREATNLGLVSALDQACGNRRSDATLSYGHLLTLLAIHRAIAPRALKSTQQLSSWYQGCGMKQLLPLAVTGLDARRVDEALDRLHAADLDRAQQQIIGAMVQRYQVSLESLAFDGTNFDSYAQASNPSQLLKRGHAKSKRVHLRLLGLGLLVTADEGLPLLSFPYPGNRADVTSFQSFLRRLRQRRQTLALDAETTVVCDGGNISKEVVKLLEAAAMHWVARLPPGHAPQADALSTEQLAVLEGRWDGQVRAKKLQTSVYGKQRTVVAVYSASMHQSQLPGLLRDRRKVEQDLEKLAARLERQRQGKGRGVALTVASTQRLVDKSLERQHMRELYDVKVGEADSCPTLTYQFQPLAWDRLERYRLGRTVTLTDHQDWDEGRIVECLRQQSYVEDAFRQMKDPEWTSAAPLRHYSDPMLRVHTFISVLALLLSKLVVRRLRQAGVEITVSEGLRQLSELRLARVKFGRDASPELKALARKRCVPPMPTKLQMKMIRILGVTEELRLGPTSKPASCTQRSTGGEDA